MELKRVSIHEDGSCNYCNRGKLSITGQSLNYPYKEVIVVRGNYITSVFCDDCFNEMKDKEAKIAK